MGRVDPKQFSEYVEFLQIVTVCKILLQKLYSFYTNLIFQKNDLGEFMHKKSVWATFAPIPLKLILLLLPILTN